jgi:hypothetical protein
MEKCFEKREYRENQVRYIAFAEVNNSKVGIVTNICREGLAFRYIDNGDEILFRESLSVNIIHEDYALYDFPCKSIMECYSLSDYYISTLQMNKCCLYFCQLTPEQKSELESFIASCTENPSTNTNSAYPLTPSD